MSDFMNEVNKAIDEKRMGNIRLESIKNKLSGKKVKAVNFYINSEPGFEKICVSSFVTEDDITIEVAVQGDQAYIDPIPAELEDDAE